MTDMSAPFVDFREHAEMLDSDCLVFCNYVSEICSELSGLYEIEETVSALDDIADLQAFLFDLSAFLGELECPYVEITCGKMEDRLDTREKKQLLISYLLAEMKSARLHAASRCDQPSTSAAVSDQSVVYYISAVRVALKIGGHVHNIKQTLSDIHQKTSVQLQLCRSPLPVPLLNGSLDKQGASIDKIGDRMSKDYRVRNLMLSKRCDVTVNSFLWSDRMNSLEERIRQVFVERRSTMSDWNTVRTERVMAATERELRIEKSGGTRVTLSRLVPLSASVTPEDRGGRTEEMNALSAEKKHNYGKGYGKPHYGGGGGGPKKQDKPKGVSQEQRVRSEYSNRERDLSGSK